MSLKITADKYIVHLKFMLVLSVIWSGLKFMESSIKKKNTIIIFLVVLLTKLFALMIDLVNRLFFRGENAAYEFIKAIL